MIKKLLFGILILCQVQATAQVSKKTSLSPLLEISMIGTAAEGWETDVVLQTTDGINYYSSPYTFKKGELKFRQGRLWTVNWGSLEFPMGTAVQSGANIPVIEGIYTVQFNTQTGVYSFQKDCVCPLNIQPVCANGKTYGNECEAICAGETTWVNGSCEQYDYKVVISGTSLNEKITLNRGGIGMMAPSTTLYSTVQKFNTGTLRFEIQEDDMLYDMAAETFPSGKATINYEITIPVKEGTYALLFDSKTGQYDFYATPYVSIAGVNLTQVDNQGNYEAKDVILGETDLEILDNDYGNDALMILYGNNFPEGVATMEVFTPVKVIPEYYNIYYNTNTKEYRFELSRPKLCGCVPDYKPVCANGKTYNNPCEAECVGGETSWVEGACEKEFPVITITGTAVGGWDKDVEMSTTDGVNYVFYGNVCFEGKIKFRQDYDWKINWGASAISDRIAIQDGLDIAIYPGENYEISLNRITGEYSMASLAGFSTPVCANGKTYPFICNAITAGETEWILGECKTLSVQSLATQQLEIYPNPVKDILNISSNDLNQAKIYDCTGRLVKEEIITNQKIDLSELSSGNYILKIQSSANQETIKIVKE